ncbi:MAG TPA: SelT/SelW/SelH family protein [Cellvibrio sp.]
MTDIVASSSPEPTIPVAGNRVVIHYCNLCRWMLRSAWLAQELLSTFDGELDEVAPHPGTGGVFHVWLNGELVWDRVRDGGFPEAKELKQRVRDLLCPDRSLGHSDDHKK